MSLFDQLTDEALKNRGDMSVLRPVVEKELLHHDILREMQAAGLLTALTFIGGTCLRACYGSVRLSEDLDFTGGAGFQRADLAELANVLKRNLNARYGLEIHVGEPIKEEGNVSTWKLRVETRAAQKHLPAQRIHIDICAIASHDPRPMMLRNLYGVDLGTAGLILAAESQNEILADKVIALAFRQGRIKNRDLWDIGWLVQQGVELPTNLIPLKINDHHRTKTEFTDRLNMRLNALNSDPSMRTDFIKEMRRFLPASTVNETIENPGYWAYLIEVIRTQVTKAMSV